MQLSARDMPCWAGAPQFRNPASWAWWLARRWGSWRGCRNSGSENKDEHRRGKRARAVCADRIAAAGGVLRVQEYCACGRQEFLLRIRGASAEKKKRIERGLRVHEALRRHS